jgi:hypothetical protein
MSRSEMPGPGTLRVGRFIGRLGIVSLTAVEVGLDLDERVVRRHVAKLETAGWLERAPWIWGQGSVAWLTREGVELVGLGGLRAVKSPPAPMTISHAISVGWTAARLERRGRTWRSSRELDLERDRWGVPTRSERGFTEQLPDLALWLKPSGPPVAVILETGRRREDRQKMMLDAWAQAIRSGQYARVHYDCASTAAALLITRLAKKVGLAAPELVARMQMSPQELAKLGPAADDDVAVAANGDPIEASTTLPREPIRAPEGPAVPDVPRQQRVCPEVEAPGAVEARKELSRHILGIEEPRPRRPWRRS